MQITVTTEDGKVFPLDISNELTLQDLQALLELETGIAQHELLLVHTCPHGGEGEDAGGATELRRET